MKYLLSKQPLASAVIAMGLVFVVYATLGQTLAIALHSQIVGEALAGFTTALLLLWVLSASGAARVREVLASPETGNRRWWLPVIAMCPLIAVTWLADAVDTRALEFSFGRLGIWALRNAKSGFFEEVWFRGVIFLILQRAWGTTGRGLHKSALVQALLFGALHLMSLTNRDLPHVLYQCGYATLIGYGFAGLVAYCRSLWPAIVLHASFNAAGGIDNFFAGSGYAFPEEGLPTMIAVLCAFLVLGALPGYWCLQRVAERLEKRGGL